MKKEPTDSSVVTLRLTPEEKEYLIKVMTARKEYKWQSLLKRLVTEWAGGANEGNVSYESLSEGTGLVLQPEDAESRYVDPDLAVIEELAARAWRNIERDELAKTIVSLLRIYGDISGSRMG